MGLWTDLRACLSGDDAFGRRGTLRWLEGVVGEAGGHPGTVRNILYKDLGSIDEKRVLFETLADWHARVGLPRPRPPDDLVRAAAKQRLGTGVRGVFARFVRDLTAGTRPQRVVVGGPRSGSTTLLEELREVVNPHVFLDFSGDVAPALLGVLEAAGSAIVGAKLDPGLDVHQPYAVQAATQADLRGALREALIRLDHPLLAVADASCHLRGGPLRGHDGGVAHPSWWIETLVEDLPIPYLVVLATPPRRLAFRRLQPPNRAEAVRFLHERLRQTPIERIHELVELAGRDYAELARAALLEASRLAGHPSERLLRDPDLGPILRAFAVLSPPDDPWIPLALLETAAGTSFAAMSTLQRSLVELAETGRARPVDTRLLPPDAHEPDIDRAALAYYQEHPNPGRQLRHARRCDDRGSILTRLRLDPALLTLAPGLWEASRRWPRADRERLATIVLRRHAVMRQHDHPEVREAMEVLRASPDARGATWANLEVAEAHIDGGRFERAREVLDGLGELTGEERARALLGQAALARWRGSYEHAEEIVGQVMALDLPDWMLDRAQLWRGLIAKDRGDFVEALDRFARVSHKPLLMARAAYHVGDALLHLGQPDAAIPPLDDALRTVETEGSAEELARVRTRRAAAMRHLGRYADAARELAHAGRQAPDAFARQRVAQEAAAFEAARGHGWEALCLAAGAVRFFERTHERPDEARFRHRFARFRLAVAQRTLESGDPYRPPFRQAAAPRAASTLRALLDDLPDADGQPHRESVLRRQTLLQLATCVAPDEAVELLRRIDGAVGPVLAGAVTIAIAQAHAAAGRADEALAAFADLPPLPPSPGLRAWGFAVCAETLLRLGRTHEAVATIDQVANLPAVFREQVGRAWGTALMNADAEHACAHWALDGGPLPLPEALAWGFGADHALPSQPPCAGSPPPADDAGPRGRDPASPAGAADAQPDA